MGYSVDRVQWERWTLNTDNSLALRVLWTISFGAAYAYGRVHSSIRIGWRLRRNNAQVWGMLGEKSVIGCVRRVNLEGTGV